VLDDGSVRWLHARGHLVRDGAGNAVRMVGTAQDITERKLLDELRDTILASVSHELRTPLTSILGFAVTLQERGADLDAALRAEILANISEQARKLERLLSDLLDLERLRHGFVRPTFDEADVGGPPGRDRSRSQRQRTSDSSRPLSLSRAGRRSQARADRREPARERAASYADRNPDRGQRRTAERRRRDRGGHQGPGVAPEERDTIFEIFTRGVATTSQGIGVGLSLVALFTALHNGKVWSRRATAGARRSASSCRRGSRARPGATRIGAAPDGRRRPRTVGR
jgi:light-regulated signal transduction histidine kinase (bacteriophytochrome)